MPFRSEAQRRYLWANRPDIAKKWEDKYNQGGMPMKGLLDSKDMDTSFSMKDKGGRTVTIKSPQGVETNFDGLLGGMVNGKTPTPVSDNKQIMVTPGEFVVNYPAAQKYKPLLEQINQEGRQMLKEGGWINKVKPKGYALGGMPTNPLLSAIESFDTGRHSVEGTSTLPESYRGKEFFLVEKGSPQDRQLSAHPAYTRTDNNDGTVSFRVDTAKASQLDARDQDFRKMYDTTPIPEGQPTSAGVLGQPLAGIGSEDIGARENFEVLNRGPAAETPTQNWANRAAGIAKDSVQARERAAAQNRLPTDATGDTGLAPVIGQEQDITLPSFRDEQGLSVTLITADFRFQGPQGQPPSNPVEKYAVGVTATNTETGEVWEAQ